MFFVMQSVRYKWELDVSDGRATLGIESSQCDKLGIKCVARCISGNGHGVLQYLL